MASYGSVDKIGKQLLDLKAKLEHKKNKRAEIQGELNSVLKQMKEEFGTDDMAEIQAQMEENEQRIASMEGSLASQVAKLQGLLYRMDNPVEDEEEDD